MTIDASGFCFVLFCLQPTQMSHISDVLSNPSLPQRVLFVERKRDEERESREMGRRRRWEKEGREEKEGG